MTVPTIVLSVVKRFQTIMTRLFQSQKEIGTKIKYPYREEDETGHWIWTASATGWHYDKNGHVDKGMCCPYIPLSRITEKDRPSPVEFRTRYGLLGIRDDKIYLDRDPKKD